MMQEIKRRTNRLEEEGVPFTLNEDERFMDIPDMHTASVVTSYEGVPLSKLTPGLHTIEDEDVMVNRDPLERYLQVTKELTRLL